MSNKYIEVLLEVRKILEDEGRGFICNILRFKTTWSTQKKCCSEIGVIKAYIKEAMGEYAGDSVEVWLLNEANIPHTQLTKENMLAYRLRWIDHMIEEFKD